MTEEILLDCEDRMDKAVTAYSNTLDTIRTGRASTALVEHLHVSHYGQSMPLNQLATLAAPEAQLITVTPWDKAAMQSIMKAIQISDLGINPSNDGNIIRLPIPPLNEQRRKDLVKQVNQKSEESRVAVRNVRRHALDELKKSQRAAEITEDDEHNAGEAVEKLTQQHMERVEALTRAKERDLMDV
ncbi:MAG: ribosome recycling factor [Chloroflexi bacterium]|nr:MAG: ribosome recycling factor [Chloroflexota bacterium]